MSNYEVNVATQPDKNAAYGRHYCRIDFGSCLPNEAVAKFKKLNEKLGDEFRLTLTETRTESMQIAGYCYMLDGDVWKDA